MEKKSVRGRGGGRCSMTRQHLLKLCNNKLFNGVFAFVVFNLFEIAMRPTFNIFFPETAGTWHWKVLWQLYLEFMRMEDTITFYENKVH